MLRGLLTGISVTMSVVILIYFTSIIGVVSWAVAVLLMGFAAVAAFSIFLNKHKFIPRFPRLRAGVFLLLI